MTGDTAGCGFSPDRLVDYLLGELQGAEEARLEEHLFTCSVCAARLDAVARIGESVAEVVRHAGVAASVNRRFLARALADGLSLREYRIPAGERAHCTAGPEDLVVVRLAADLGDATDLEVDVRFENLESGDVAPSVTRPVFADRDLGEVILVFPGEVVRAYPRSVWTLTVHGDSPDGSVEVGPFVMDHTPA